MPTIHDSRVLRRLVGALCALMICAIVFAALRPFHSPLNEVSWVSNENSVRIGRNGTLLSSGTFRFAASDRPSYSLEIWLEPALVWTRGTILSFYAPSNPTGLSVRQDYTNLVVQRGTRSRENRGRPPQIQVEDIFREPQIFLTVTSDGRAAAIYVNGSFVRKEEGFGSSAQDLAGQLIVANSPLRDSSWTGQLRGLAIYNRGLSATEVIQHYLDWTQRRQPPDAIDAKAVAFYTFHDHKGRVIHDEGTSGIDLYIPERFQVVDHFLFEPLWSEIYTSRHYFKDGMFNIAGFIPLGFLVTAYFAVVVRIKRPALCTILVGASVSFLIELIQAYLPTRYSGMTDIITNTLGTAIGAAFYRVIAQREIVDRLVD